MKFLAWKGRRSETCLSAYQLFKNQTRMPRREMNIIAREANSVINIFLLFPKGNTSNLKGKISLLPRHQEIHPQLRKKKFFTPSSFYIRRCLRGIRPPPLGTLFITQIFSLMHPMFRWKAAKVVWLRAKPSSQSRLTTYIDVSNEVWTFKRRLIDIFIKTNDKHITSSIHLQSIEILSV